MKHFKIVEIISKRKVQIGVIVILLIYVFIHLLMMKAYPFADVFSSFGGIGVPHNTELNPIIEENHISALKTDVKVPQVEKLSTAETMRKLFEWKTRSRAATLKTHPPMELKAAFMCDDIEIPILVIDDNEKAAVIRRSNDDNLNKYSDFDWADYPKVSDINVKTRFGYRMTLSDVLAEVSRPKPNTKPLQYAPPATLTQGGQNHELTNEAPAFDNVDNNSLNMLNDKYDEHFTAAAYTPCTNSLCNSQQFYNRSSFPVFNVQFFQ